MSISQTPDIVFRLHLIPNKFKFDTKLLWRNITTSQCVAFEAGGNQLTPVQTHAMSFGSVVGRSYQAMVCSVLITCYLKGPR